MSVRHWCIIRPGLAVACLLEQTILRFASGRMSPAELAAAERHARRCASCQSLLAAALAAASSPAGDNLSSPPTGSDTALGTLEPGTSLSRYTLLSFVGQGAMAEVYAAYDPKLDRRVALKLLRTGGSDHVVAEARLLREAQAIAQLSHPNVIAVHDVGALGERVFVAMEFVEGQTLSDWLAAENRSRSDILTVFLAAARGLAAAHAAGLVHRDVKPQNVMVGVDGSVRVTDFGLVRRSGTVEAEPGSRATEPGADRPIDASLTQTGDLIGTPLYMAPEQFRRERVDARTDQFSFCVALYQALYGEHPFADGDIGALVVAVTRGQVRSPPSRTSVPPRLRRVLLRGMAVDPAARWSSMEALSAALVRDPARRLRRGVAATAGLLLAIIGAAGVVHHARRLPTICTSGGDRVADVWGTGTGQGPGRRRRDAIRTAFLASGAGYAKEIATRVDALLERYATQWLQAYADACQATHMRGEQSASVLDLRMACLDQRLASFRSLTDLFIVADRQAVMSGVDAANALPALERCADVGLLLTETEPPRDEAMRGRIDDLRRRATRAKELHDTGHNQLADEEGRRLIVEARQIGYAPLLAELLEMVGSFHVDAAFTPETVETLEESVWIGIRSKRDDVAAEAAALLAGILGYDLHRQADGERWASFAEALIDRKGYGNERTRAWILQSRAGILYGQREYLAALRLTEQALALKREVLPPDHPDIGLSLTTEAETLARMGDYQSALEWNARARDLMIRAYGAGGPFASQILSNRGEYLIALGRPAEALPLLRDALAGWEAALTADHPFIAYPLTGLGRAELALGRPDEALPVLRRALRIREASEPDPAERAETRFALAQALRATGARLTAIEMAQRARDEYASTAEKLRALDVERWVGAQSAHHGRRHVARD